MKLSVFLLALSLALGGCFGGDNKDPMEEVLGTINGKEIRFKDVKHLAEEKLERHEVQLHAIKRSAFQEYAEELIIKKAAQAEGSNPEEYFNFFQVAQPREVTDAEREEFEKKLGVLLTTLNSEQQEQIKEEIKRNRLNRAKRRLVNELVSRNAVNFMLATPPSPIREKRRQEQQEKRQKMREEAKGAEQEKDHPERRQDQPPASK